MFELAQEPLLRRTLLREALKKSRIVETAPDRDRAEVAPGGIRAPHGASQQREREGHGSSSPAVTVPRTIDGTYLLLYYSSSDYYTSTVLE